MDRKLIKLILLRSIKLCLFVLAFSLQLFPQIAGSCFGGAVFRNPVYAGWYCEPVYGGGERCWGTGEILIDKTVKNASTGLFVDNLGLNDYKFAPGEEILFRLEVKNTGSADFAKVTVKDIFPSYLDFVWGPLGWNSETRILQFDIYDLKAGESRQFEIMTRVFEKERLPDDRSLICVVNTGRVEADEKSDEDQAQACFEKKVLGVEVLPPTGAENGMFIAFGLLITTIFGAKLAFAKKPVL